MDDPIMVEQMRSPQLLVAEKHKIRPILRFLTASNSFENQFLASKWPPGMTSSLLEVIWMDDPIIVEQMRSPQLLLTKKHRI